LSIVALVAKKNDQHVIQLQQEKIYVV